MVFRPDILSLSMLLGVKVDHFGDLSNDMFVRISKDAEEVILGSLS